MITAEKNILYPRYTCLIDKSHRITNLSVLAGIMQYAQFCKSLSSKCYSFPSWCEGKGTLYPWGIRAPQSAAAIVWNWSMWCIHWQTDWQGKGNTREEPGNRGRTLILSASLTTSLQRTKFLILYVPSALHFHSLFGWNFFLQEKYSKQVFIQISYTGQLS